MVAGSWVPMLVLVFLAGVLANQPWAIAFSVTVSIVLTSAYFWQKHALDGITYQRKWHYRRGFPGEKLAIQVEINNRKLLPVSWFKSVDPWPYPVGPQDETILGPSHMEGVGELILLTSMRWFERIVRSYTLVLRKRGVYEVGPAQLQSGDFFGLFEKDLTCGSPEIITVFPELLPLAALQLRTENPFGELATPRRLFDDPNRPIGIRDYRSDDSFRHIHWPASARTGALQVKIYQPISARLVVICLNTATSTQYWLGFNSGLLEQLIKVAATLAYNAKMDGYSVGLVSNGCLAQSDQPFIIQPGRSPEQLPLILQALAGVTPFSTAPFERFLLQSMPKLPYGATLVVVSGTVSQELCECLLMLRRYRANTTLISLEQTPPPDLPGIRSIHLPFAANPPGGTEI